MPGKRRLVLVKRRSGWIPKSERTHLICKDCKKELPIGNFVKGGRTKAGAQQFSARCKPCHNKNAVKYDNRVILFEYIKTVKTECVRCGYDKCDAALEFHHINPDDKNGMISEMVRNRCSLDNIKKEITKCVVLCANCHRELHHEIWEVNEVL